MCRSVRDRPAHTTQKIRIDRIARPDEHVLQYGSTPEKVGDLLADAKFEPWG